MLERLGIQRYARWLHRFFDHTTDNVSEIPLIGWKPSGQTPITPAGGSFATAIFTPPHSSKEGAVKTSCAALFTLILCVLLAPRISAGMQDQSTIVFDKPLHFRDADGNDIVVPPGTYRVDEAAPIRLRLATANGMGAVFLIQATEINHEESLSGAVARTMPGEEGLQLIRLLLPGNKGLEASGSLTGIGSRATLSPIVQAPTSGTPLPSISGTASSKPLVQPHATESDRDMIVKTLDIVAMMVEQLKLLRIDIAQAQQRIETSRTDVLQRLDGLAVQIRRTPGWSTDMPPSQRWEPGLTGQAVLDRSTGLVWEQRPYSSRVGYAGALEYCSRKNTAGYLAWRLPTATEMQSLLPLAPGHPFALPPQTTQRTLSGNGLAGVVVWTIDQALSLSQQSRASVVEVLTGQVEQVERTGNAVSVWCVRGGSISAVTGQVIP